MSQLSHFWVDINRTVKSKPGAIILFMFTRQFWAIFLYRIDRSMFLLFGSRYRFIRFFFYPVLKPIEFFSNAEISYRADIGPGIKLLHGSNGLIISKYAKIGENATFVSGTVIGLRDIAQTCSVNSIRIGNNCTFGANSVVLGPIEIGDDCLIGALALVIKDAPSNSLIVGVPAVNKRRIS